MRGSLLPLRSTTVASGIVFGRPLIEQPLMRQMLADLALEVEAATALVFRLARAFDRQKEDATEQSFMRLMTPAIKYWVCKNLRGFAFEAMECLGGNGYVEDWPLARLYREAPINAIWEGSGNIMCLDVQRALRSNPEALERVLDQCPLASSAERALLQPLIEPDSVSLRRDIERLVHLVAASLLARHARASWSMPMCGPASKAGRAAATASKGRRSTCSSIGRCPSREVSEAVEHALQDPGGSQLVDQLGAAGAARVAVDQHPLDGHRRQPFVPKNQRDRRQFFEIAGERPCRLGAWPLAAVHIEG